MKTIIRIEKFNRDRTAEIKTAPSFKEAIRMFYDGELGFIPNNWEIVHRKTSILVAFDSRSSDITLVTIYEAKDYLETGKTWPIITEG